jgi:hypothetical protein
MLDLLVPLHDVVVLVLPLTIVTDRLSIEEL